MMMQRTIFTDEHEMFRASVRRFVQNEIAPQVPAWLEAGIVDRQAFKQAGEQGLLLMWADERYGGASEVMREITARDPGLDERQYRA